MNELHNISYPKQVSEADSIIFFIQNCVYTLNMHALGNDVHYVTVMLLCEYDCNNIMF